MKKLITKLSKINILWLVLLPPIFGMVLIIGVALMSQNVFQSSVPLKYSNFLIAIACFITSIGGFAQIIRKESPGITYGKPFTGIGPIISGYIWVIICIVMGGINLYAFFME